MKWGRIILVIFGALSITALGIDAADTNTGSEGTLLSQVISKSKNTGPCPKGMSVVDNIPSLTCVDTFEASAGNACPEKSPEQVVATQKNLETSACSAESQPDTTPWRFVTRDQALQMCARSGKRIPTSEEWYALSLGMAGVEQHCNINENRVSETGKHLECKSPHGAYDLVGNVWEWVSDDVINGTYKSSQVPESGYVAQVDASGMATLTSTDAQDLFGKDYFWSRTEGAYGIIRGGYYDSGTDAGVYTVHADTVPTTASIGIGFRCVK
jgi:hypothetical protein